MKIDVNQTLKAVNGDVLKDNDGKGNVVDATLKIAIVNALLSPVEKEIGTEKVKKLKLAIRVYEATDEIDLTAEEIVLIKERVNSSYPLPLVVGRVFEMLEKTE